MFRAFSSPWRSVGLGQPGPAPPAFALLGIFPVVTLGAAGAAQKLLVLTLGVVGFAGAYRMVADLVDRAGRFAAGAAYMMGAVGYAGLREGSLGSLVFGAAAPFVVLVLVRLTGWVRPPGWNRGRAVARLALGSAVSAAFVPGSLAIYALVAVLLVAARAFLISPSGVMRSLATSLGGIAVGWVLLLPWSGTWFDTGGPLAQMLDHSRTFQAGFAEHGMGSVLLGQTPQVPVFFGLSLPILGVLAVVLGEGQRKRLALLLWAVIASLGLLITAIRAGALPPFVASPTEAGIVVAVCFAGLAGIAVGAFRLDLPRRDFGYMHWVTLAALSVSIFLAAAGLGPALLHGEWEPGRDEPRAPSQVVAQIGSLLDAEAESVGPFRALWVGSSWAPPTPTAARPVTDAFLTAPLGQSLTDLFETGEGEPQQQLERVIGSVESGATDEGGALLGVFNVRYVVLETDDSAEPWLGQRDLGLIRTEPDYLLLENQAPLARAAIYDSMPGLLAPVDGGGTRLDPVTPSEELAVLEQRSSGRYGADEVPASGDLFLAEANHEGWKATAGGDELDRTDAGWGNGFVVPGDASGSLLVRFPRTIGDLLWLVVIGLAWITVLGSSFSRRRPPELLMASEAGHADEGSDE
jgi:hypothetical protein